MRQNFPACRSRLVSRKLPVWLVEKKKRRNDNDECRHDRKNRKQRKNIDAYKKMEADLEEKHFGKVALMHNGRLDGVHNNFEDAVIIGVRLFGEGNFSCKKIGEKPIQLGTAKMYVSSISAQ